MEKTTTLGNGFTVAIAVLFDSIKTWLNGRSEFFTALLNAGEDDYVEVSRLQVISVNLCVFVAIVLIGIVGNLENF